MKLWRKIFPKSSESLEPDFDAFFNEGTMTIDELLDSIDLHYKNMPWYDKAILQFHQGMTKLRRIWYSPWLSWFGRRFKYQLGMVPEKQLMDNLNGDDYWDQGEEFGGYTNGPFNGWFVMEIDELMTGYHAPHYYGAFDQKSDAQDYAAYLHEMTGETYYTLPLLPPASSLIDRYGAEWVQGIIKQQDVDES